MKSPKLRMYILVKDSVPDDYVPLMCSHVVMKCYRSFYCEAEWDFDTWYDEHSMAKVICRVTEQEFQQAIKEADDYIIQSETNGLDPEHLTDCVAAFVPRYEYPKCFQFFKLWKVRDKESNEDNIEKEFSDDVTDSYGYFFKENTQPFSY